MEGISTKEKIRIKALHLFASYGYDAVSVAQIAKAVGIQAPSLYKHYASKEDIFHAIIREMEQRYAQHAAKLHINGTDAETDMMLYEQITDDQLVDMGLHMFSYFLHDEYESSFRKMLNMERYHNKQLADLFQKQYFEDAIAYQTMIFQHLMQAKILKPGNPKTTAIQFYAPIFLLLELCDSRAAFEREAIALLQEHIRQFLKLNSIKQTAGN
ncbi:TetR/AcrR family transcriptional regulator [Erysipelotrichaceae bacterium AF15-26LB]|nr:transcriptional regulator, TetR family [Erysipelotrichaceae bacterium 3_1_53]MCR0348300.1 TetR/AcrR family transcriptional regulator [[Clostridium] innocuum]RJV90800.1 TetR/AcrR family transcriptional regulator [Erysipelotrichaceae bacterium AF15-26LB]RJV93390.1 TetR/AcrR family transcriptional regulator [Erysipelotrichaceae bacterium AF19-24AC]